MQIRRVNVSLVWSIPPRFPRHQAGYRREALQVQGSWRRRISLWANWHLASYRPGTPDRWAGPQDKNSVGALRPPPASLPQPHYHTPETKLCLSPGKGGGKNWIIQTRAPSASQGTGWAKEREKIPGKSGSGRSEAKVKVTLKIQQRGPPSEASEGS